MVLKAVIIQRTFQLALEGGDVVLYSGEDGSGDRDRYLFKKGYVYPYTYPEGDEDVSARIYMHSWINEDGDRESSVAKVSSYRIATGKSAFRKRGLANGVSPFFSENETEKNGKKRKKTEENGKKRKKTERKQGKNGRKRKKTEKNGKNRKRHRSRRPLLRNPEKDTDTHVIYARGGAGLCIHDTRGVLHPCLRL